MKNKRFPKILSLAVLALGISMAWPTAASAQWTGSSVMSVSVAATGTLTVLTATTSLTSAGGFAAYTGSTNLKFRVRTTGGTGSGSLTVSFASDWSPSGGPSITASPTQLSFTCGAVGGGPPLTGATACAGTQSVSALSTPVNVVTFAAGSKVKNGTETQSWTMLDDESYTVGTYTATATYTLSVS